MKSVSEKKSGGHRTSKIVKSRQSPIIVHFSTWRARAIHDVACEFTCAVVRSKDAQKQLARTSLTKTITDFVAYPETRLQLSVLTTLKKRLIDSLIDSLID